MSYSKELYSMKTGPSDGFYTGSTGYLSYPFNPKLPIRYGKGFFKALEKMLRDPLTNGWNMGILKDDDDNYWSRTVNHDPSKNEEVIVCFNPKAKKLNIGIMDSTGSIRAYDETQRCPYEALIPIMGYFWDSNSIKVKENEWNSIKTDFLSVISDYKTKESVDDNEAVGRIMSALYYVGLQMIPIETDDFEEVRELPLSGMEIAEEMFPTSKKNVSFYPHPEGYDEPWTDGAGEESTETSLEKLINLKNKFSKIVKDFVSGLDNETLQAIPSEARVQDYIPTPEFNDICKLIADNLERGKMYNNILFWGPPGNGKSAFAQALAFVFQLPYRFEQGFGSKDAGDYAGTTIATDGILNTSIETSFVKAVRDGGVFADDDFNYARESEQTFKNSVLEAPYTAKLANQTEISRNKFFIYIATANPDCQGARRIPEAFKNRCFIDMYWKPLSDDLLMQHIEAESDYHDKPVIAKMLEVYHTINTAIGTGMDKKEEANNLTPRNLVFWANQTRVLKGNAIKAAEYNIIGALGSDASPQFINQVRNSIIKPRFRK